ncbi:MAG: glycosyltransferase family 2 protein [Pirellulales bacterium]|nr:glycosyltransferase family 2 protein [Pirellulales bacterium]
MNFRSSTDSPQVWVVVPAFNEATRVGEVLASLRRYRWRIVLVDDGSSDATAEVARQQGVVVLRHMINRGQGAALQTGIDYALSRDATAIVTFDADGQHSGHDLQTILEPVLAGQADVCLGSRFLGRSIGIPPHRMALLKAAVWFTRWTTGLRITDTHNGLRALSAGAAGRIRIREDRMAHASDLLHQIASHQLRYVERPVTIRYSQETLDKGQRSSAAVGILTRVLVNRMFQQ